MIVECPDCYKKFELPIDKIGSQGRLLQCGKCGKQWFFSLNESVYEDYSTIKDNYEANDKGFSDYNKNLKKPEPEKKENTKIRKVNDQNKEDLKIDQKDFPLVSKKTKKVNYFKIFIVLIITFVSIIILLDTFKEFLSFIFPNIENILKSLYETFKDIGLFMKDLLN